MTSHRRDVRPRYGRIGVLAAALTVSAVAALGGFGILATSSAQAGAGPKPASYTGGGAQQSQTPDPKSPASPNADDPGTLSTQPTESNSQLADGSDSSTSTGTSTGTDTGTDTSANSGTDTAAALPADSGSGRRIVFDQSDQRVWLVGSSTDEVQKTYLVSGSVTNNLQPGTYSVYSKSRWAVGIDDSGVMQYFVRFTQGPTGAAIGFHSIPTKNGVPLQSRAQLGTPESHGCIRQYLPDAISLWDFAPVGTKVVVVA